MRSNQRNLHLNVDKDGNVVVSAPYGCPMSAIEEFIDRNILWIEDRQKNTNHRKWVSGETLLLGGESVLLLVEQGKADVFSDNNVLYVFVRNPDNCQSVKNAVYRYCSGVVLDFAKQRIPYWCSVLGIEVPEIRTGNAKTRWGVCNTAERRITLSVMNVSLTDELKDLIVFHELCHLVYKGHGHDFHNLMEKYMPDVKQREKKLREAGKLCAQANMF